MVQDQPPVADEIDVDDIDIRVVPADVVAPREFRAYAPVAALVMDRLDANALRLGGIVVKLEHAHLPHQARA